MANEQLINDYKVFYKKVSLHKGRRTDVLAELAELIKRYHPFVTELKTDKYFYEKDFSNLISDIENFLKTNFKPEIFHSFENPPKVEKPKKKLPPNDLGAEMIYELAEALKENSRRHPTEKVNDNSFRFDYLCKILSCLQDFGLHNEIHNRDKEIHSRFNIVIEHRHNTRILRTESIKLISFKKLNDEYLKAYRAEKPILINGTKIPCSSIQRFTVTSSVLKDDEVSLFMEKIGVRDDLGFIFACHDETNNLLENSSIVNTIELNAEIWNLIHSKLQKLVKPLYYNGQFNEAVRTAFIELNDIIKQDYRQLLGEELDGDKLMRRAFSPGSPVFQLTDLSTQNGHDTQQGYMELFAGSMKGIRNPNAHKNMEIGPIEALEKIIIASHLLKVYDMRIK